MVEDVAGYAAAPLSLYHCNLLRLMGSPFLPPFRTPGPGELAAFLWVVNPKFIPGRDRTATHARAAFMKTCRRFVKPAEPALGITWSMNRWERRAGEALDIFIRTVTAARQYVTDALRDRPGNEGGVEAVSYYSDFCHIAAALMRNYRGLDFDRVQFLPTKIVFQFLKEIREHNALEQGQAPAVWGPEDDAIDEILALLNRGNRN